MRGPIDYIIVGFEGNKFNGSILKALSEAVDKGIIGLVDLALITKNAKGDVAVVNIADLGDKVTVNFIEKHKPSKKQIGQDDIDEMADLLENSTSAGLLVVEQLWAKPLKQAIIDAKGVLVAEGRIHPEAAEELSKEGK